MATNTVNGVLVCRDGTHVPLKTEIAEGTETELQTDSAYSVTSMSAGDFALGKTVVAALVTADNSISYAYILRQGLVAALIPIGVKGASWETPSLFAPITLQAGDQVRVLTLTASARNAALCYYTNRGISRIAIVTVSGAATNELVDLQTGNSIGDTVQGQFITRSYFTTVDNALVETQGAYVVDALGNVVGSTPQVSPAGGGQAWGWVAQRIPVNLNFKAQFLTSA